jgi:NAD(P)-dependent dehydrogenase (short-subunit alcohol dehydrogenase family)
VQQNVYMSAVRACRPVLPHLLANRSGTIVTTGDSIRAPNHGLHAYSAPKAAVANFTKTIATTYGARGIRANCVCPGAVRTATVESTLSERLTVGDEPDDVVERRLVVDEWRMPVAMERLGRPREIGEMMAFLLSDRAAYTNGAIINVDGGTDF